jgi:hypothetical protein
MPNYPIVGAHYRPPAKAILSGISPGTKLFLRAEPSNEFDVNAIQVLLKPQEIIDSDHENLDSELSGYGQEISDLWTQPEWHLGYIPKEVAKVLKESGIISNDVEYEAEYVLNFSGKPMISLET